MVQPEQEGHAARNLEFQPSFGAYFSTKKAMSDGYFNWLEDHSKAHNESWIQGTVQRSSRRDLQPEAPKVPEGRPHFHV